MNKKRIIKAGAVIIKDGKVLIAKETGWKKYGIPRGTIKLEESDTECLRREMKEEFNANIVEDSIEFLGCFFAT